MLDFNIILFPAITAVRYNDKNLEKHFVKKVFLKLFPKTFH